MVTQENYYTEQEHFSVSSFKRIDKCELDGTKGGDYPTSTAMLIGSYVDSWLEGTLGKFKEENPEIFSTRGETKGQLKSDFKQADEICDFIKNDKNLSKFLSGEKQTIMVGEIEKVPFKIKMDSYHPNRAIVDLKVMRTITDNRGKYVDFISMWNYDIQLACYQEIVYQNTGVRLPCYIAVVTKETPMDSAIIQIPQSILDQAMIYVRAKIVDYWGLLHGEREPEGCGHCATCKTLRKVTPIISMRELMGERMD